MKSKRKKRDLDKERLLKELTNSSSTKASTNELVGRKQPERLNSLRQVKVDDPIINALYDGTVNNHSVDIVDVDEPISSSQKGISIKLSPKLRLAKLAKEKMHASAFPNLSYLFSLTEEDIMLINGVDNPKDNIFHLDSMNLYDEHLKTVSALCESYNTSIDLHDAKKSFGLTSEQVSKLQRKYGFNETSPPPKIPFWLLFVIQLSNILKLPIFLAGIISIAAYFVPPTESANLYLGVLLILAEVWTTFQLCSQEKQSDQLMQTFLHANSSTCTVIRNGKLYSIDSKELVIGDIIRFSYGDVIPADCRIVENMDMQVDINLITGESDVMTCSVDATKEAVLEAGNILFKGSLVISGTCYALVIRVGDDTLIGHIAGANRAFTKDNATLQKDVSAFVRYISRLAIVLAAIVFIVGVARGLPVLRTFIRGCISKSPSLKSPDYFHLLLTMWQ